MEEMIVPFLIFVFALMFYVTGLQKNCWYRRYMLPALFIILAFLYIENFIAVILILIAVVLLYYGFRGYGRDILEEKEIKEEKKDEEKKE